MDGKGGFGKYITIITAILAVRRDRAARPAAAASTTAAASTAAVESTADAEGHAMEV